MKFNLIVCELHNELIHGPSDIPYGHYIASRICKHILDSDSSSDDSSSDDSSSDDGSSDSSSDSSSDENYTIFNDATNMTKLLKANYRRIRPTHLFIRNYVNIINKSCFQPQIAECIYIGEECTAIIKTFWLKIIQRTWKKIYAKRMNYIKNPTNLFYRQMRGPMYLPTLRGMLAS